MRFPILPLLFTHLVVASACLLEAEKNGGHILNCIQALDRRQTNQDFIPIGTGNRFHNGYIAPRGLGAYPTAIFSSVYNVAEIKSAVQGLVREFRPP